MMPPLPLISSIAKVVAALLIRPLIRVGPGLGDVETDDEFFGRGRHDVGAAAECERGRACRTGDENDRARALASKNLLPN